MIYWYHIVTCENLYFNYCKIGIFVEVIIFWTEILNKINRLENEIAHCQGYILSIRILKSYIHIRNQFKAQTTVHLCCYVIKELTPPKNKKKVDKRNRPSMEDYLPVHETFEKSNQLIIQQVSTRERSLWWGMSD